jgi:hypothetical protein
VKRTLWGGLGWCAASIALWVGTALGQASDDRALAEDALAHVGAMTAGSAVGLGLARDAGMHGDAALADGAVRRDGGALADPGLGHLASAPSSEARRALERARGARAAGDVRHAELLEGLAREWAETARDVLRAVEVEREASGLESTAADVATRAQRARALLEEDLARRGRAEAELARVSATGTPFATSASSASGRGAGRPPVPARPSGGSRSPVSPAPGAVPATPSRATGSGAAAPPIPTPATSGSSATKVAP